MPERDEHVKSAAAAAALGSAASYLCTPETHGKASEASGPLNAGTGDRTHGQDRPFKEGRGGEKGVIAKEEEKQ